MATYVRLTSYLFTNITVVVVRVRRSIVVISKSMIEFSRCYLVDVLNRFFFVSVGRQEQSTVAQWCGAAAF